MKLLFLTAIALAVLGYLGILGLLFVWDREMNGEWPGKPLQRFSRELELSNGGTLGVHSTESRTWAETGFDTKVTYRRPGTEEWEEAANWYALSRELRVRGYGSTVVLLSPDQQTVHLRPANGAWWRFSVSFLSEMDAARLAEHSIREGISGEDILSIREGLDAEERRWSPSCQIKDFDNESGVLTVSYWAKRGRIISFRLDPEGTRFRFFGVRLE